MFTKDLELICPCCGREIDPYDPATTVNGVVLYGCTCGTIIDIKGNDRTEEYFDDDD